MTASPGPDAEARSWTPRFEACFESHFRHVLAYALRRIGDRAAAEDVAAETFLVAWRRLELMPDDRLPWLLAIARNVVLNELRAGRRRQRLLARVAAEPAEWTEPNHAAVQPGSDRGPLAGLNTNGLSDRVEIALGSLGDRDREVLLLTAWDGLDHRQAAAVLGCSPTAFGVRVYRARKRLAKALDLSANKESS
ncbi:hypothetical protein AYO39_01150 [Actinobacteria bacterium SCGC AG-212-D09]|nr:hypothetical protein AYO39_01150 [Actinobacteria bacterium SCGC AG-212-D09]